MNIDQAEDTDDTTKVISIGAHEDTYVQKDKEDKPQEYTAGVITHQLEAGKEKNTATLMDNHECETPRQDHKKAASFENMMGGNQQGSD